MMNKVTWVGGYKAKVKPDIAYRELERIRKNGSLTAGAVVTEASKKTNPLHPAFEWDNRVAAEEHRLEQARRMMRSIQVIVKERPKTPVRGYEITTQPQHGDMPERKVYEPIDVIMKDPMKRDELLSSAIRDALAYRRKYHALSELAQIFSAMDDFLKTSKAV